MKDNLKSNIQYISIIQLITIRYTTTKGQREENFNAGAPQRIDLVWHLILQVRVDRNVGIAPPEEDFRPGRNKRLIDVHVEIVGRLEKIGTLPENSVFPAFLPL